MRILLTGLNHRKTPVEIREKVHFQAEKLENAYQNILTLPTIQEAVLLSTCNRVEIYCATNDTENARPQVKQWLHDFHGLGNQSLNPWLYEQQGLDTARHLFAVATGIDSLIVGEGQIQGQVRDSYFAAREFGCTGALLNKTFSKAIETGKRARSQTEIGRGAVSIAQAGVELSREFFADLSEHQVLVIGAGSISDLTVRHLRSKKADNLIFTNRTREKAEAMGKKYGGQVISWEKRFSALRDSSVVMVATSSPDFVLKHADLIPHWEKRTSRPLYLIDLSVPRNVEPSVGELADVFLYSVDDLKAVVDKNLAHRQAEIVKVKSLIEAGVKDLGIWNSYREKNILKPKL